jgi:hypothetical protein
MLSGNMGLWWRFKRDMKENNKRDSDVLITLLFYLHGEPKDAGKIPLYQLENK